MYHRSPGIRRTSTILITFAFSAIAAAAQFVSGVSLVEVYATVTDAAGEPLTGLLREDFTVEEDGVAQRIEAFAAGDFPLAVAIAIDRSFSVTPARLGAARAAAVQFIGELRAEDQVMVLAVGSEVEVVAPLSGDRAAARASLERLERWGTTPLYDAAAAAIDAVAPARGRRALIILSDGTDRYSRTPAAAVVDKARRSGVLIYPVALGRERPPMFAELATVSGGRSFHAVEPRQLPAALAAIAKELRFQYLLGYAPVRGAGGRPEWRTIRVGVSRPGARVRARDGYLSR